MRDTLQPNTNENIAELYEQWFVDYASYVILDRAIPHKTDGLKPVQRRLLYALYELDDGRYNKAANVIGHTMRYHPHGDAAIADALVKLAQKGLVIDPQGNWGNAATGDKAAAPRYIEARLTPFAREVLFNSKITEWQDSYDGRKKEPITLPAKFPLLLAHGTEGIAVGLATKILPHNFCELLQESIAVLKGFRPQLVPDFPTGGLANFSEYRDGRRGGKVRVRAVITELSAKILQIKEIPFGVTTVQLIDSIIEAHEKELIKIKKVEDNTAQFVDVHIHLQVGTDIAATINALYAHTLCEVSISPSCCVIDDGKPEFTSIGDLLTKNVEQTKKYLQQELLLEKATLEKKINFLQLETLFITHRIYRKIENQETWEKVLATIRRNLEPLVKEKGITLEDADVEALTEIKIKQISKFDQDKTSAELAGLEESLKKAMYNLAHLTNYTIAFYKHLLKKYGQAHKRRTRIENFSTSSKSSAEQPLLFDMKTGTVGFNLNEGEQLFSCAEDAEVMALRVSGSFKIFKASTKAYVGEDAVWIAPFSRDSVFCLIYAEKNYETKKSQGPIAKRFQITTAQKNSEYPLIRTEEMILFFGYEKDGGIQQVFPQEQFFPDSVIKVKKLSCDFATVTLKARNHSGVALLQKPKVEGSTPRGTGTGQRVASPTKLETKERATPSAKTAMRIWYDRNTQKFNTAEVGLYLGKIKPGDTLTMIKADGKKYPMIFFSVDMQLPDDAVGFEI